MYLALVPLFAYMDRMFGSDVKYGRKWAAAGIAAATLIAGIAPLIFAVLWFGYRSIGFFGGSGCPTPKQYPAALARHAIAVIPFVTAGAFYEVPILHSLQWGGIYALVATTLAITYGRIRDHGVSTKTLRKWNFANECARGAAFGAAVMAWLAT